MTGGSVPLALGVLQVLSLDIATDLLPALALGAESSSPVSWTVRRRAGGSSTRGCSAGRSGSSAPWRPPCR